MINILFQQSFLLLHQFSTFSPNPVFGNIAVHQKYLSKIFYYGNWSSISFNYIDNRDLLKDKTNVHMFMESNLKKINLQIQFWKLIVLLRSVAHNWHKFFYLAFRFLILCFHFWVPGPLFRPPINWMPFIFCIC